MAPTLDVLDVRATPDAAADALDIAQDRRAPDRQGFVAELGLQVLVQLQRAQGGNVHLDHLCRGSLSRADPIPLLGAAHMEGARVHNVVASYLHGSLLPKNPAVADHPIRAAVERRLGALRPTSPGNQL